MKNKKTKNLNFKLIPHGISSNDRGTYASGSLKINQPITQKLNVNVNQSISYSNPKDKGSSIKLENTSFGFEKDSKKSKITGHLTGNIENKKVFSFGGSYKRKLKKGQSITASFEKNKGGGKVGLQYRKEFK